MKGFLEKWLSLIKNNFLFSIFINLIGISIYTKFNVDKLTLFMINHTKFLFFSTFIVYLILLISLPLQRNWLNKINDKFNLNFFSIKIIKNILSIVILSLFMNFLLQFFQMNLNIDETILWIYTHKKIFLLGTSFLFFLNLLILSIIGELRISNFISVSFISTLGLVHYLKLKYREEPFYPTDILQITHLDDVSKMVLSFLSLPYILLSITLLVIIIFLLLIIPKQR